jgi:hemolysin D
MPKLLNDRSIDPVDTNTTPSKIFSVKIPRTDITIPLDDWSDVAKSAINTLPKVWTRGLLYFIVVFTGIALPWAMFSQIDETGTGRGRLETKGTSNRLESATAGTVTAVRVREGQTVEQGQVLLELESDAVRTEIQQAKSKLEGQMNRLSQLGIAKNQATIAIATQQQQNKAQAVEKIAQAEQAEQNLDDKRSNAPLAEKLKMTQIEQARKSLNDSQTSLPIQKSEKAAQLRQARQKLVASKTALIVTNNKHQQNLKEVQRYQALWAKGGVPEIKLVEVQSVAQESAGLTEQAMAEVQLAATAVKEQEDNYNKTIHQLQSEIRQAESTLQEQDREYLQIKEKQKWDIKQAESRLKEQQGNRASITEAGKLAVLKSEEQLKDLQSQIGTLNTEIAQTKQQIGELERQLAQKVVRAPVNGTILQLPFKQPKSFVQTGQLVAQIAPQNASTVLKVQMPSQNSGFLKTEMPVKVKFDAYPFQDYGVVTGKVLWVSPDSKMVDVGTGKVEVFEVDVVLDRDYIQSQGKKITLGLGSTATAEVIIRQRRTIDFILDPFKKLQKDGLSL